MAPENNTEKVSVNINTSTLSSIDLLVDNGYYSNRSDFVNQAVRETLRLHQRDIDRVIGRHADDEKQGLIWFFGIYGLTQNELNRLHNLQEVKARHQKLKEGTMFEGFHGEGQRVSFSGYGVLSIADDIDEEMLFETVAEIKVRGRVYCSDSIKAHYGLRK